MSDPKQPQIIYQIAEPDPQTSAGHEVHLWDYVQIVLQRLPLAMLVGATVMTLAIIYTWTRTPKYRSTAQLLVKSNQINLTEMKGAIDTGTTSLSKREYMQTQAALIKSRPVLEDTINKLNLLDTPEFSKAIDPVKKLRDIITVSPARNTQLINVSVERHDPRKARRILNTILSSYMDGKRSRRIGLSKAGQDDLRKKSEELRIKLQNANKALQSFMVTNNLVSFEKTQNVVIDRLLGLSTDLTKLQPKRMELQASIEAADAALKNGSDITSIPCVMASPIVQEMKIELSKLGNDYSQLIGRLGENHQKVQSLRTQIQALQTKLALESNSIINSTRIELQQTLAQEKLLAEAIKEQKQKVYRFNRLKTEYDSLSRKIKSIEMPYNTVTRRIEELDINRMGDQGENVFIVETASLPKVKSWPSKSKNLMVAFILASGLAVGLCFFLDYMDTTVKNDADVRRLLHSKVLAVIPDISQEGEGKGATDMIAFDNTRSHTAEAFRSLRTALAFSIPGEHISSVVISSALPSEGKSLAAINLAVTQAQSNKRTVIIDADMRKPRLHKSFDNNNRKGLSTLINDPKVKIDDIVQKTKIDNLDFIPCGPIPRNPAELLESDTFQNIISRLRDKYDFIVFDSPPGFALVDSLIIGKYTDGLIMVVRSFSTPKAAAQQFGTRLEEADVRILGVAMNNVDMPRGAQVYGGYCAKTPNKYYREEDPTS